MATSEVAAPVKMRKKWGCQAEDIDEESESKRQTQIAIEPAEPVDTEPDSKEALHLIDSGLAQFLAKYPEVASKSVDCPEYREVLPNVQQLYNSSLGEIVENSKVFSNFSKIFLIT